MTQPQFTQQPYGYAAPQYAPRPKRPPLSKRQRGTARVAGAVSFSLLTLGWMVSLGAISAVAFVGLFTWIFELVGTADNGRQAGYEEVDAFIRQLELGTWSGWLLVAAGAGVVAMVVGLLVSALILRSSGAARPWAITWAGFGIAIVAHWALGWIPWFLVQLVPGAFPLVDPTGWLWLTAATIAIAILLSCVVAAVIGALAWWWMAHALRAGEPTPAAAAPSAA